MRKYKILSGSKIIAIFLVIYLFLALVVIWLAQWVVKGDILKDFGLRLILFLFVFSVVNTLISFGIHEIGYRKGEGELRKYLKKEEK